MLTLVRRCVDPSRGKLIMNPGDLKLGSSVWVCVCWGGLEVGHKDRGSTFGRNLSLLRDPKEIQPSMEGDVVQRGGIAL